MGYVQVGWQCCFIYGEIVVLGSDYYYVVINIFYWVVVVVVVEFYFNGFGIVCQCQQLMVKVDVEYWNIGFKEFFNCFDSVIVWCWVVRVVGEEDIVWIECQYVCGGGFCWYYCQVVVVVNQYLQDVVFCVEVICYNVEWQFVFCFCFWQVVCQGLVILCLVIGFCGGYFFC